MKRKKNSRRRCIVGFYPREDIQAPTSLKNIVFDVKKFEEINITQFLFLNERDYYLQSILRLRVSCKRQNKSANNYLRTSPGIGT